MWDFSVLMKRAAGNAKTQVSCPSVFVEESYVELVFAQEASVLVGQEVGSWAGC